MSAGFIHLFIDVKNFGGHCSGVLHKKGSLENLWTQVLTAGDKKVVFCGCDLKAAVETEADEFITDNSIGLKMFRERLERR